MTYGVTSSGFVKKTLTVIQDEINTTLRDTISPTLNLLATSVFGQIIGIFSDKLRECWDVSQAVYRAFDPDYASGDALDNIGAITGVTRLPATQSTVTLDRIWLDANTVVPAGSRVSVGASGAQFETIASFTAPASPSVGTYSIAAQSVDYGEIVGLANTIDTIQTPISGWSAKAQLSSGTQQNWSINGDTLTLKVDGGSEQTVTFTTANPVNATQAASEIQAQTTGLTAANVLGYVRIKSDTDGTGSSIEITGGTANVDFVFSTTLVQGFNTTDAIPGSDIETDEEFRIRREELLRAAGSSTVEAIRSKLLELSFVEQATVFENVTDATDVDGVPPHAFEAVIVGGTETDNWAASTAYSVSDTVANDENVYTCSTAGTSAASGGPTGTGSGISDGTAVWDYTSADDEFTIAETLWENKAAGIATHGTESRVVTDTQAIDHTIEFSRPTDVPIYIDLTVKTDADLFPSDGSDQIKAALVAEMDTQLTGEDVIALVYKSIPLEIAGVIDVTAFLIDDVDPPVGSVNVVIASREQATLASTDIDVTVTT
jgi:hypothetical protein